MSHECVVYVANKHENDLMKSADLRADNHFYVRKQKVVFDTTTEVDQKYLMQWIVESERKMKDHFIVAISYNGSHLIKEGVDSVIVCP